MGMWPLLALFVDAGAVMLDEGGCLSKPAVGINRKHANAATRIIGRQDVFAFFIHNQMAWACSPRRLLIEQSKIPSLWVDSESADGAAVFLSLKAVQFTDGIQEAMVWMNGKKGGVLGFRGQGAMAHLAGRRIEFKPINALAVIGASGVSPDKDPKLLRFLGCGKR